MLGGGGGCRGWSVSCSVALRPSCGPCAWGWGEEGRGSGFRRAAAGQVEVGGGPPTGDGSNVLFSLPFWRPLDAAELERDRVLGCGGSTVRACPDGHGHDRQGVKGVWEAVCMQLVGTAFALKEGRAGGLVAGALVAQVAWAGYIVSI